MVFGKIDYLNLLPFYVFSKRYFRSSSERLNWSKKAAYPSLVNLWFNTRRIDFAIISSVESFKYPKYKKLDFGVVAQKEVLSVLIKTGSFQPDKASASSNMLALILGLKGQVIIGNKALSLYAENTDNNQYIDLAKTWQNKTGLPFVFARLCTHKYNYKLQKIIKQFFKTKIRISDKIITDYAQKLNISKHLVHLYLSKISYKISKREKRSLTKFQLLAKQYAK